MSQSCEETDKDDSRCRYGGISLAKPLKVVVGLTPNVGDDIEGESAGKIESFITANNGVPVTEELFTVRAKQPLLSSVDAELTIF